MAAEDWTPLRGGNVNAVSRRGATVRRELSAASPAVHGLLRHLEKSGPARVPQLLGSDARYEYLTFLPGEAVFRPWPDAVQGEAWLTDLGSWLRAYGRAAKGFRVHEADFLWGPAQPFEAMIVCHGDLGPWNLLHRGGQLSGVIDWDLARYGHPLDDAAALALETVPLHGRHAETLGAVVFREVLAARLETLCRAYGVPARVVLAHLPVYLEGTISEVQVRAAAGVQPFVDFEQGGICAELARDREYLLEHWC
jgi:hypothetical protein